MKLKDACSLKKSYDQPRQHIKKQRHYFANKVICQQSCLAMIFPIVLYGCKSWTINKAEDQIIDGFELWCWRRFLRVPWTARSNQSIPKEISLEYSLEGLMLKLQYLGHWCLERLKAGGEGDNGGWDGWMASPTQWMWVWGNSWSQWWTEKLGMLQSMGLQSVGHNWGTELKLKILITVLYPVWKL